MGRERTEADLARVVVRWLEDRGFDVYQEVELVARGIRADIVARRGPEISIIETKTSASLALVAQVMERRRFAHRVYAACPRSRVELEPIFAELGIGLLRVWAGSGSEYDPDNVTELVASRRWNSRPVKLASKLRPEHKTACAAGSPTGGHWSRYRDTCAQLANVVAAEPGITLREALGARVRHHYVSTRSAIGSLRVDIDRGQVPGVVLRDGALWPKEDARG